MKTPTIKRVKSKDGNYVWQVTYAGMCKEHVQSWQAMVFYHQLVANYQHDVNSAKALQLSQDSILDAASTSPTIPDGP